MEKIVIKGISKLFGRSPTEALRLLAAGATKEEVQRRTGTTVGVYDVNLTINAGEVFVVMGLSGSGKSTLLRCINRIHNATTGQIIVDGQDITALNERELREVRRKKFGMVFQRFALVPHRTVLGNVAYVPRSAGRTAPSAPGTGPGHPADRRPGGMGKPPPRPAQRWHAATGRPGPCSGRGPGHPAHGRSLQRARSPYPQGDAGRTPRAADVHAQDHRIHHPRPG